MSARENAERVGAEFAEHVKNHVLTILRDDGVYRHLRFGTPGTNIMRFDVVTWPGFLAYTGDMGCFVFSRVEDMLEFFRHERPNFGYWAEKVRGVDRAGLREWSAELFRASVSEWVDEQLEGVDHVAAAVARELVEDDVLRHADDEHEAMEALRAFACDDICFADAWEMHDSFMDWKYNFAWCCYALPWAVKTYDAATAEGRAP